MISIDNDMRLYDNLMAGFDYTLVPKSAWNKLCFWYGLVHSQWLCLGGYKSRVYTCTFIYVFHRVGEWLSVVHLQVIVLWKFIYSSSRCAYTHISKMSRQGSSAELTLLVSG